jgi:diguanylate cyclase (GGDEF)-like protein/PAS domain S-box-containing protein
VNPSAPNLPEPVGPARLSGYEIRTYRVLLAVTSVLVLALQPLYVAADPLARDPWLLRALTAAACLAVLATTFRLRTPSLRYVVLAAYAAVTAWLLALVAINAFAWQYALTLLVFVAGLAAGIAERRLLTWYGLGSAAGLALVILLVQEPRVDLAPYIGAVAILALLSFTGFGTRMRVEERLVESRQRFALAAWGASDGLWDWNVVRGVVFYSTRWKATLGYAPNEIGHSLDDWLDRVHPEDRGAVEATLDALHEGGAHFEVEYRMRHADGTWRNMLSRGAVLRDRNGRVLRVTGSQVDITSRKRAEQQLLHDALHDTLTGLPNRALFLDRLERFLHHAQRRPSFRFAVLFIDLDRFKVVNDSLGHPAGDSLLIDVARRLELLLRPEDTLARLGGDEFAVLVDDVRDGEAAVRIADRIQQALNEPFRTRGQRLYVSASIGIALGGAGSTTDALLRDADTAMYRAKRQRSRYALFDEAMHAEAVLQLELENDIRHAIERNEFVTHYQPLVRLDTGELIGFEALVRWQHPQRGLLMPDVFVPLAEETGLISDIGRWVLDESCALLQRWQELLPEGQPFVLSVNVSGKQFLDERFADEVISVLRRRQVPHSALKLELTETAMMEDSAAAARVLDRLRAHGVSVWIDDFGTGYSSLAYLQRLPVGSLKISRHFMTGLENGESEAALVRAIVSLAATLGLETIAEGVETEAQRQILRDLGCRVGQGWLFAPALDAEAATRMLRRPLAALTPTSDWQ